MRSFESGIDPQMLCRCQILKKHIVLRADSEDFPHVIHVIEDVLAEALRFTFGWSKQASQHGQRRGFSGAIVTEQCKNLTFVHFQVDSTNCLLWTELFDEIANLEAFTCRLLSFERVRNLFKVPHINLRGVLIIIEWLVHILIESNPLALTAFAEEVPWLCYSVCRWDYLVQVETDEVVENSIECEPEKSLRN